MKYKRHTSKNCVIPFEIVERDSLYHRESGNPYYGVAGTSTADFYLFHQFPTEQHTPKKDCALYRYYTPTVHAGGMFPIVSLNEERGLMYFWVDELNDWTSRGLKLDYLCVKDYNAG
jgi:hypothetical protein